MSARLKRQLLLSVRLEPVALLKRSASLLSSALPGPRLAGRGGLDCPADSFGRKMGFSMEHKYLQKMGRIFAFLSNPLICHLCGCNPLAF